MNTNEICQILVNEAMSPNQKNFEIIQNYRENIRYYTALTEIIKQSDDVNNLHFIILLELKNILNLKYAKYVEVGISDYNSIFLEVRNFLFQYLSFQFNEKNKKMAVQILIFILDFDFFNKHNDVPELIKNNISTENLDLTYYVLLVLNGITKKYLRLEEDEVVDEIDLIIETLGDTILNIIENLTNNMIQNNNFDLSKILKLIIKSFYHLIYIDLSEYFDNKVNSWFDIFKKILNFPDQNDDIIKIKGYIIQSIDLFHCNYREYIDKEFEENWHIYFENIWSICLSFNNNEPLSKNVKFAINFLFKLSKNKKTKEFFKNKFDKIFNNIIVNCFCNSEDENTSFLCESNNFIDSMLNFRSISDWNSLGENLIFHSLIFFKEELIHYLKEYLTISFDQNNLNKLNIITVIKLFNNILREGYWVNNGLTKINLDSEIVILFYNNLKKYIFSININNLDNYDNLWILNYFFFQYIINAFLNIEEIINNIEFILTVLDNVIKNNNQSDNTLIIGIIKIISLNIKITNSNIVPGNHVNISYDDQLRFNKDVHSDILFKILNKSLAIDINDNNEACSFLLELYSYFIQIFGNKNNEFLDKYFNILENYIKYFGLGYTYDFTKNYFEMISSLVMNVSYENEILFLEFFNKLLQSNYNEDQFNGFILINSQILLKFNNKNINSNFLDIITGIKIYETSFLIDSLIIFWESSIQLDSKFLFSKIEFFEELFQKTSFINCLKFLNLFIDKSIINNNILSNILNIFKERCNFEFNNNIEDIDPEIYRLTHKIILDILNNFGFNILCNLNLNFWNNQIFYQELENISNIEARKHMVYTVCQILNNNINNFLGSDNSDMHNIYLNLLHSLIKNLDNNILFFNRRNINKKKIMNFNNNNEGLSLKCFKKNFYKLNIENNLTFFDIKQNAIILIKKIIGDNNYNFGDLSKYKILVK